jgi:hypothetical protein
VSRERKASPVLGIAARLALMAFFTWEAVRQFRSHDFEFSLFGGVIFGVHELGHLAFAPFGELLTIAGGSIAQVALPAAAIGLFAHRKDRYAVAVCGCWLAISLGQLAVYIGDARAESLDLVSFSPEGGGHDWNYLLERWNLLRRDVALGHFTRFVGWLVLALSWLVALDALQRLARGTPVPTIP